MSSIRLPQICLLNLDRYGFLSRLHLIPTSELQLITLHVHFLLCRDFEMVVLSFICNFICFVFYLECGSGWDYSEESERWWRGEGYDLQQAAPQGDAVQRHGVRTLREGTATLVVDWASKEMVEDWETHPLDRFTFGVKFMTWYIIINFVSCCCQARCSLNHIVDRIT